MTALMSEEIQAKAGMFVLGLDVCLDCSILESAVLSEPVWSELGCLV